MPGRYPGKQPGKLVLVPSEPAGTAAEIKSLIKKIYRVIILSVKHIDFGEEWANPTLCLYVIKYSEWSEQPYGEKKRGGYN
jgi:hypothetical protein